MAGIEPVVGLKAIQDTRPSRDANATRECAAQKCDRQSVAARLGRLASFAPGAIRAVASG